MTNNSVIISFLDFLNQKHELFIVGCHNAVTANEQGLEQISFTAKLVDSVFKLFQSSFN